MIDDSPAPNAAAAAALFDSESEELPNRNDAVSDSHSTSERGEGFPLPPAPPSPLHSTRKNIDSQSTHWHDRLRLG